jgi:hypothetical protein
MHGQIAVFAGPSKPTNYSLAAFSPPASAGDLHKAVDLGAESIILADTLFLDAAPTHREIMQVMERGVAVYGCSSAGALRAIELRNNGMIGHGCIYRLFRRRILCDDGELASILDSDFSAVSPPLIELRYYFGYLVSSGVRVDLASKALAQLSRTNFMRRSAETIFAALNLLGLQDHSGPYLKFTDPEFRLKQKDLRSCMQFVSIGGATHWPRKLEDVNWDWMREGLHLSRLVETRYR